MAFCITFGTHDFHGQLQGYENVTAQCHNCGNWSARCITEWPFFTLCFVPIIPLAFKKYHLVACPICNYKQDMSARPDVQSQAGSGGGGMPTQPQGQPPQQYQMQPQGQYQQPQYQGGPPQGQSQYK